MGVESIIRVNVVVLYRLKIVKPLETLKMDSVKKQCGANHHPTSSQINHHINH